MRTWNLNLSRVFCIIIPLVSVSRDGVSLLLLAPSWTIKRKHVNHFLLNQSEVKILDFEVVEMPKSICRGQTISTFH